MKNFQLEFLTNKQNVRILTWLSIFQRDTEVTVTELIDHTGISAKTIATDIAYIKKYFASTIDLTSSNRGYTFSINSSKDFLEKKRALLAHEPLFILIESIFMNRCLSINEWSEKLYLSVSTLLRYLRRIEPIISGYNLALKTYPVDFDGSELDIRSFFHDFYYESDITPHTIFPTSDIQKLALSLKKSSLFPEFSFISLGDFNYIVYIALTRYHSGKPIEHREGYRADLVNRAMDLGGVISSVSKKKKENINLDEKVYLYMMLLFRRSVTNYEHELAFQKNLTKNDFAEELAISYANMISTEEASFNKIFPYVRTFFYNQILKYNISPVLIQNIEDVSIFVQKSLSNAYLASLYFIEFYVEKEIVLSNKQRTSFAASLALFTDSLKMAHINKSHNIAFLLEGNYLVCEYIRLIAFDLLGTKNTLFFPSVLEMTKEYFQENSIDIVVTNYSEYLFDSLGDVNYILFELMPTEKNWTQLLDYVNKESIL
ncbi:helix-turn-helix domain-containing protein [Enterococcus mundtii]